MDSFQNTNTSGEKYTNVSPTVALANKASALLKNLAGSDFSRSFAGKLIARHAVALQAWTIFMAVAFVLYYFFSSGDFSVIMTLGSLVSLFSFTVVAARVYSRKSVEGISINMFTGYAILSGARLCSVLFFNGYLPFDSTGDGLYQAIEVLNFFISAGISLFGLFKATDYSPVVDSFKIQWLAIPALIVALFLHPNLNEFMPTDVAWAFALYLEAVVALPQLFLLQKEKKVDVATTHFLAAQTLSKVLVFTFWLSTWHELNDPKHAMKMYIGHWIMLVQIVQLIISSDFVFHYVRCIISGRDIQSNLLSQCDEV